MSAKLPNEIPPSCRMKSCQVADCVLGICFIATIWLVFFFEKNMKSTCIILRMVYIIYRNKFLLRGFLFHALLNVNTDLRIWNCRRFAHKSTNKNRVLTTFMLKKTWLYSPFAQKKFERTTFRNAKNNRRKLRGELILPSKRVALIRSCPVDHCFVFQHRCLLNGAFFISR